MLSRNKEKKTLKHAMLKERRPQYVRRLHSYSFSFSLILKNYLSTMINFNLGIEGWLLISIKCEEEKKHTGAHTQILILYCMLIMSSEYISNLSFDRVITTIK